MTTWEDDPGAPPELMRRTPPPATAPGGNATSVIDARGLVQVYGEQRAVDGVDLVVSPGTIVGVIGPSGCGKSTLVRMLTGIERPTEGTVRVFGADPADASARQRSRFGYMPQLPVLFPNLTAWANLRFIASMYGVPVRGRSRRLLDLLDLVDLRPHRRKQVANLSGGMQRRLTLAATLVHDPELLFLDEPTAGVDPVLRERFWNHFRDLRDEGRTIVVPTQYVGEAVSCDAVAVMAHGRLICVQPPDRLAPLAYGGVPFLVQVRSGWLGRDEMAHLRGAPGVRSVRGSDDGLVVVVDEHDADPAALATLLERWAHGEVEVSPLDPSYDEVFVRLIERFSPATTGAPA
jgi:ABC-2 type transport system ATP-binding protein